LALTRPKTPKKEQSGSPPGSNNSRQQSESSLRSPISDIAAGVARSITKTPNIHTNNDSGGDINSPLSNAKIPQSPLPPNEKLNHHASDNSLNNNGVSQQQQREQRDQQFSSQGMGNGPEKILPSPSIDRKDFEFSKVNGE
jgi:hypothetical protein